MKSNLTEKDIEWVYNNHLRNKCFDINKNLQDLQTFFRILAKDKLIHLDRYMLVERQLQLTLRESQALISVLDKVTGDFVVKEECTCPKICDCQNPPPPNGDRDSGIYHISNSCPVHNDNPDVDPDCPIHGEKND